MNVEVFYLSVGDLFELNMIADEISEFLERVGVNQNGDRRIIVGNTVNCILRNGVFYVHWAITLVEDEKRPKSWS